MKFLFKIILVSIIGIFCLQCSLEPTYEEINRWIDISNYITDNSYEYPYVSYSFRNVNSFPIYISKIKFDVLISNINYNSFYLDTQGYEYSIYNEDGIYNVELLLDTDTQSILLYNNSSFDIFLYEYFNNLNTENISSQICIENIKIFDKDYLEYKIRYQDNCTTWVETN